MSNVFFGANDAVLRYLGELHMDVLIKGIPRMQEKQEANKKLLLSKVMA